MNREQIQALQELHPEAFAEKRAAGLTDQQAAAVIAAQIEHDKANPPHLIAAAKARSLIGLANNSLLTAQAHITEAEKARDEALALDPSADLPAAFSPDIESEYEAEIAELREELLKLQKINGDIVDRANATSEELAKAEQALKAREAEVADLQSQLAVMDEERNELAIQLEKLNPTKADSSAKPKKK